MSSIYNFLMANPQWGFGIGPNGTPALYVFGFPIYAYALIIVAGMCMAILVGSIYFKKRGYDPYDMLTYAIVIIPIGVLGARLYVYIFPWAGRQVDWSTFFNFRTGGLGIYGGVILGYIAAFVTSKVKKQDFRIIADCIIPGLFLAQSIGRWGNFVNGEAHGNLITNPSWQWFPFGVEIGGQWFQATFFYESMATLIGFVVCILLARSKHYKLGWQTAFYGIYYGIVRLFIEGLRTDSLYLWIGQTQTDIKISQLVSVFTIILGLWTLSKIYRQQLHKLYSKMFATQKQEVDKSRWVLLALAVVCIAVAVIMFVIGGESNFIVAVAMLLIAVYSTLAIFSLTNRLGLYCKHCNSTATYTLTEDDNRVLLSVKTIYSIAATSLLLIGSVVFLLMGLGANGVANQIVLAVIMLLVCIPFVLRIIKAYKELGKDIFIAFGQKLHDGVTQCQCGQQYHTTLSAWLLAIFPFKRNVDYGVEMLKPYVDASKAVERNNNIEE